MLIVLKMFNNLSVNIELNISLQKLMDFLQLHKKLFRASMHSREPSGSFQGSSRELSGSLMGAFKIFFSDYSKTLAVPKIF